MANRNNRQRILDASIDLFNASGTVTITTNHIAEHLRISPGNLYFHFRGKEEIVRELFARMCDDVHEAWNPKRRQTPHEFLERSFDVFWKYRFFHREMYHLRRRDPELSKMWKSHLRRCQRLLMIHYGHWRAAGELMSIDDPAQMKLLADSVLLSSSAYLAFFESPEKPATRRTLRAGIHHVSRLLWPYFTEDYRRSADWLTAE